MARPRKINPKTLAKQVDIYVETHDLPFISSICTDLKCCSKDTMYRLAKECPELSDSIKRADAKCEGMILQRSLMGQYNGSVGIFLLKNYGWSDKQQEEVDTTITVKIDGGESFVE